MDLLWKTAYRRYYSKQTTGRSLTDSFVTPSKCAKTRGSWKQFLPFLNVSKTDDMLLLMNVLICLWIQKEYVHMKGFFHGSSLHLYAKLRPRSPVDPKTRRRNETPEAKRSLHVYHTFSWLEKIGKNKEHFRREKSARGQVVRFLKGDQSQDVLRNNLSLLETLAPLVHWNIPSSEDTASVCGTCIHIIQDLYYGNSSWNSLYIVAVHEAI